MSFPEPLTIVIPAYRCGRYLPATVASAVACGDYPILIAEDHGGDGTLEVARRLREGMPGRISLIENDKNLGMTANWQNAINSVQSPYTLKLDGDDLISPRYIRAAMAYLAGHDEVAIVGGANVLIDAELGLGGEALDWPAVEETDFQQYRGIDAARFAIQWAPYPASGSTIYRMDAWRQAGGFNVALNCMSDREMWFRMARRHEVAYCRGLALRYRKLPTGVMARYKQSNKYCYELSRMWESTRRLWPEGELRPLFRRAQWRNAGKFFESAGRAVRNGAWAEVPERLGYGCREMWLAM